MNKINLIAKKDMVFGELEFDKSQFEFPKQVRVDFSKTNFITNEIKYNNDPQIRIVAEINNVVGFLFLNLYISLRDHINNKIQNRFIKNHITIYLTLL